MDRLEYIRRKLYTRMQRRSSQLIKDGTYAGLSDRADRPGQRPSLWFLFLFPFFFVFVFFFFFHLPLFLCLFVSLFVCLVFFIIFNNLVVSFRVRLKILCKMSSSDFPRSGVLMNDYKQTQDRSGC